MPFYIIENKVYTASSLEEAKETLKTTQKGKREQNRGKPIQIGKVYIK